MDLAARPPASVEEALDDVAARFLVNLPPESRPTADRIFFVLQQAHWYYVDFYVDAYAHLPHLRFQEFSQLLFERSPVLVAFKERFDDLLAEFRAYASQIPSFGVILFNDEMDHVLAVQPYRGKNWGFPKGKINAGESHLDCAVREGQEEVGFNARHLVCEEDFVTYRNEGHMVKYFIGVGAPFDFPYQPLVRKEIGRIRWIPVSELFARDDPKSRSRFWTIRPILGHLHTWMRAYRRGHRSHRSHGRGGGGSRRRTTTTRDGEDGDEEEDWEGDREEEEEGEYEPRRGGSGDRRRAARGLSGGSGGGGGGGGGRGGPGRRGKARPGSSRYGTSPSPIRTGEATASGAKGVVSSSSSSSAAAARGRGRGRGRDTAGVEGWSEPGLEETFGAEYGSERGWSTDDMFRTVELVEGVRLEYDGNPHDFGLETSSSFRRRPAAAPKTIPLHVLTDRSRGAGRLPPQPSSASARRGRSGDRAGAGRGSSSRGEDRRAPSGGAYGSLADHAETFGAEFVHGLAGGASGSGGGGGGGGGADGIGGGGAVLGWSSSDMFATVERMTGERLSYDGSNHGFGMEGGFGFGYIARGSAREPAARRTASSSPVPPPPRKSSGFGAGFCFDFAPILAELGRAMRDARSSRSSAATTA